MRVFVLPLEGSSGPIAAVDGGEPLGFWSARTLIGPHAVSEAGVSGLASSALTRIALWSGGVGEGDDAEAMFEPDPRTWMSAGRDAFAAGLERAAKWASAHGSTICLRPHARHVLSDTPSLRTLLGVQKGGAVVGPPPGIEVLLDPIAMLTPRMLATVEDHLERVLSLVATLPGVIGIVASNIAAASAEALAADLDEGPALQRVPLRAGVIDPALIARAIRRHNSEGLPIVLEPGEADAQLAILRA